MKRVFKIIGYALLVVFILFQLYPRPTKNASAEIPASHITRVHNVPSDVQQLLQKSCYDCHSNNTNYPWYSRVQPVSMWLGDHIEEGKKELNLSEFGNYSLRRQYRKLEEIDEEISENHMPLSSYTLIHTDSKLSGTQKKIISDWVVSLRAEYAAKYPADSLIRKK